MEFFPDKYNLSEKFHYFTILNEIKTIFFTSQINIHTFSFMITIGKLFNCKWRKKKTQSEHEWK